MTSSSVIYVRTPLGRSTAFNPASTLKEPLRSLLKAVDGKANSDALAERFADIDDVAALLDQLETQGLITDRGAAWPAIDTSPRTQRASGFGQDDSSLLESGFSISVLPDSTYSSQSGKAEGGASEDWANTTSPGINSVPPPTYSLLDRMAQQAADAMGTFILTHLPAKAFTMLGQVEKIHTTEELKSYLPAYETEIEPAGEAAQAHMSELKLVLDKLF